MADDTPATTDDLDIPKFLRHAFVSCHRCEGIGWANNRLYYFRRGGPCAVCRICDGTGKIHPWTAEAMQ